ncbi:MAG: hypothetical protein NTZ16_15115 [Verrucomicrobia bacterium]|nr:hypothetical protein [Verrucomicrobiota bacterium]
MGDRCYMSVTCRREDQARFEELGFVLEVEPTSESLVIEMVDEEANYAHADQMPTDIPYTAAHGGGSNYGAGNIACDGKEFAEVAATNDGFVVDWDYRKMKPRPQSLTRIRHYLSVDKKARAIIKTLRQQEPHKHLFSPTTNLCHHCGIHADDDLVENQPCVH